MTTPKITTVSLPAAQQSQPYSAQLTGTGGIYPVLWSASIVPNTGTQFSLDPITGILSGTPGTVETESVTAQYTDSMTPHNVARAVFSFPVNSTVVIQTSALPNGTVGIGYPPTQLNASGGVPPYTWTMSPTTLDGLTLSTSGVLSGTPISAQTVNGTFTARDSTNTPSAPVSLVLTVASTGTAPDPPSAMWPGNVMSDRIMVSWWPPTSVVNSGLDTYTYNVYRSVNNGPYTLLVANIPKRSHFGSGQPFYWFWDGQPISSGVTVTPPLTPATNYSYKVTTVAPGGAESAFGPIYSTTTNDTTPGSAPPAPVADPDTWIQTIALPPAATRTTWLCTNLTLGDVAGNDPLGSAAGLRAPNTTISGCSFNHALTFSNPDGGDLIVLTGGATYATPSAGYTMQPYTGNNGWTYIITSELPLYNAGGALPAYEYNTDIFPVKRLLTATPAIGATSGTLGSNWTLKSGVYPVTFSSKEKRMVTFTKNSAAITWNNGYNPNGWQGAMGPGLVLAATTTLSVVYLPSVTHTDEPALACIQFGGTGTSGLGMTIPDGTTNVRFVGIWFKPKPQSAADLGKPGVDSTGTFMNFVGVTHTGITSDSIYYDRCMTGGDIAKFTTSGPPNYTITSTEYGTLKEGFGNHLANHTLAHQCYFQGATPAASNTAQDAQGLTTLAGGPICMQNCYFEAVGEGWITGGGFVPQASVPHDITCRYCYNTKLQWWQWAPQTRFYNGTVPVTYTATAGQTVFSVPGANFSDSWRYMTTVNGVVQDPNSYTVNPTANTLTFSIGVPAGSTVVIKNNVQYLFGDHVKDLWELKVGIRANVYGNVHQGGWDSLESGQRGLSFNIGCKDQISEVALSSFNQDTTPFQTCPWAQLTDVDIHDNLSIQVGAALLLIGVSRCPSAYTQRIRFRNNTTFIQADMPHGGQLYGIVPTGTMSDMWFENNTFILDPANCALASNQTRTIVYTAGTTEHQTIITNICDAAGMMGFDTGTLNSNLTSGIIKYLVFQNNLTVQDTGTGLPTTGNNYYHVPYTSIGFVNFVDNLHPPVLASDWNVISSTYIGVNGQPVGATLEGAGVPAINGTWWAANSVWNVAIPAGAFTSPIQNVSTNGTANVIATYQATGGTAFFNQEGSFTANLIVAPAGTANRSWTFTYQTISHTFPAIPATGAIATMIVNAEAWFHSPGGDDSDRSINLYSTDQGQMYDIYPDGTSQPRGGNGPITITTASVRPLNGNGWWNQANFIGAALSSGTASGADQVGGSIKPSEWNAGVINHALMGAWPLSISGANTKSPDTSEAFIYPARGGDGGHFADATGKLLPEGARLQLDPSLTDAQLQALGVTTAMLPVCHALQKYGWYNMDIGGTIAQIKFLSTNPNSTAGFNGPYANTSNMPMALMAHMAWIHGPYIVGSATIGSLTMFVSVLNAAGQCSYTKNYGSADGLVHAGDTVTLYPSWAFSGTPGAGRIQGFNPTNVGTVPYWQGVSYQVLAVGTGTFTLGTLAGAALTTCTAGPMNVYFTTTAPLDNINSAIASGFLV